MEIHRFSINKGIEWHFNPPAAPHFGGLWEAGVKSVKTHLNKIGCNTFTFEEFTTLLNQIEACLNSRPLCPLSSGPTDLQTLTPAHFLIGDSLLALADAEPIEDNINLFTKWQMVQHENRRFWRKWQQEYTTRLQQRPKWQKEKKELAIGDLVSIGDTNTTPTYWPLGRVIEIHPGNDGLIRVATVKTSNGVLKRPITKLALLPNPNTVDDALAADSSTLADQCELNEQTIKEIKQSSQIHDKSDEKSRKNDSQTIQAPAKRSRG